MPEVIAFIERIIVQGFAYPAGAGKNKSVYFDVEAFRKAGHTYGKLKPWAVGSAELAADGERDFGTTEKKGEQDFALWKAAKDGEPFWESAWGRGRPGWHIECSAMIESVVEGGLLDIHSGGEDLKFPHHDNEIAQSEAYKCGTLPNCVYHTSPARTCGNPQICLSKVPHLHRSVLSTGVNTCNILEASLRRRWPKNAVAAVH
jgi:cysteinyl-tRNA synthetase